MSRRSVFTGTAGLVGATVVPPIAVVAQATASTTFLAQHDSALALRLIDAGLVRYGASQELTALRHQALDQLRERYQQLNPFKFIVYSEWAGAESLPVTVPAPGSHDQAA
jgi:hypothetical protein